MFFSSFSPAFTEGDWMLKVTLVEVYKINPLMRRGIWERSELQGDRNACKVLNGGHYTTLLEPTLNKNPERLRPPVSSLLTFPS